MKFHLILLTTLFIFLAFGCGNIQDDIAKLEASVAANLQASTADSLITKYMEYNESNPQDTETNAKYLLKAGGLKYKLNQFPDAAKYLTQVSKNHFNSSSSTEAIVLLASTFMEKLQPKNPGTNYYQQYVEAFPSVEDMKTFTSSSIENIGKTMYDEKSRIAKGKGMSYINLCELYAGNLRSDSQSPSYLFKAAQTARTIQNPRKAIAIYDNILKMFPNHDLAPESLFMKGFLLDSELGKINDARQIYQKFINKYPNNEFADDTAFLLKNLGKSDNEILETLIKQNEASK